MKPTQPAVEMAVWSEERWAEFEADLQQSLRAERNRRARAHGIWPQAANWCLLGASALLLLIL